MIMLQLSKVTDSVKAVVRTVVGSLGDAKDALLGAVGKGKGPSDVGAPGKAHDGDDIRRAGPATALPIGRVLVHGLWNTGVTGADNVPKTGAAILAANHTGVIDGPVLLGASPRGAHVIIKQEMFKGLMGKGLHFLGQIPVDRRHGRAALKTALGLLEEGRVVGIFPEGSRGTGAVAKAQAGIAFLAVHSGAPVVPVAILGTRPTGKSVGHVPGPRTKLHVVFGEPFQAADPAVGSGREALQSAMETIQARLEAHVDAAAGLTGVGLPDEVAPEPSAAADSGPRVPGAPGEGKAAGHEIRVGRRMAAPPEAVWAVLTDIEGTPDAMRAITKVDMLTPGEYGVGTKWRETRTMWGREATEKLWVTVSEAPRLTVIEANPGKARYTTTFAVRPAGTGSQVEVRFGAWTQDPSMAQRAMWAVFGVIGAQATKKMLAGDLEDIAKAALNRPGSD